MIKLVIKNDTFKTSGSNVFSIFNKYLSFEWNFNKKLFLVKIEDNNSDVVNSWLTISTKWINKTE